MKALLRGLHDPLASNGTCLSSERASALTLPHLSRKTPDSSFRGRLLEDFSTSSTLKVVILLLDTNYFAD